MTDAQRIRRLTRIEQQLLAIGDAIAAAIDDEDALVEALGKRSPRPEAVGEELKRAKNTAYWAVQRVREELRRLGAEEP